MFDPVDPKQRLPALEEGILRYWQEEDVFKRSIRQRSRGTGDLLDGIGGVEKEDAFSFYDGPPFATGLPHYGHLLAGTIKDVIPRYQTMRGKAVERRFGWDCHGLPVENIIEQEQNIKSHREIEAMGVDKFNALCRAAVQRYTKEWRAVVERMGRFVDMDWDYRTMDPEYMESIWWVFSELYKKKLVYEGHKPMHVCPRCVTPLSNFEVTQGYKDITDLSVTVKFELVSESGAFILAWTTTPWTLPGNLLLAVDPKMKYVKLKTEKGETVIFAKAVYEKSKDRHPGQEVLAELAGKQLIGKRYVPLFPYFKNKEEYANAYRIVGADFVTAEEGTGIVHIAPGFGEDDYNLGKKEKLPILQHVTMEGKFVPEVMDFAGMEVKPAEDPGKNDRLVTAWLEKHGKLFAKESVTHSYPHCWRCESPLLNYATSSWFVRVEEIKDDLLKTNAETEWVPSHVRDGRFGKWLEGARDWAVSRNRYWGTPLPIWRNMDTGDLTVIASRDELMAEKRIRFTKITTLRHGESEGNLVPIYQCKEPGTSLTDRGRAQAKATATLLKSEPISAIYCSPLKRTRETAAFIAEATGAPVIEDNRLREVNFGEFEGKTVDFSDLAFVKARRAHKMEKGAPESIYHFPGMETWNGVQKRISEFLTEVLPLHRGGHIVIVTHADPIQNIYHFFGREDPLKLSHQPYPLYADPHTFFWDHETQSQLDLHKHIADSVTWSASPGKEDIALTLIRHGQTDLNKEKLAQGGNIDPELNATGREQVRALAQKLKGQKFDVIISSDLKRATETAEILSKELHVPHVAKWKELRERDTGDWTGQPNAKFEKVPTPLGPSESLAIFTGTPPNGESLQTFLTRMESAIERIRREFPSKHVLLACHYGTVVGFKAIIENLSFAEMKCIAPKQAEPHELTLTAPMRRIPEVLDCWFESGSMPYAQSHFPFEAHLKSRRIPPGFPADFVAENLDQTRGWFYTLMVLSTALFNKPAFWHAICGGMILAEDGKKMSKRLKNYPDPSDVINRHGADALRFALMSSPVVRAEEMRFSEKPVEEAVRAVLLPLWNVYSFFVTYANAAGFEPMITRRHSDHPLDCWIRAEAQDLVNRMTKQLDRYDLSAGCAEIHDTIDALTNWYVRLSRRRFAGKGEVDEEDTSPAALICDHKEECFAALGTLYDVLLTISQVLAPFCPFITDAIYVNLVPESHGSIHLTDWPEPRALSKEERKLMERNRLLRAVTSLGYTIRAGKKLKVRQPLARATVAFPPNLAKSISLTEEDRDLLKKELNVKDLEITDDPGALARRIALVDARKVGPRLGARVQEVIRVGKDGDFTVREDGAVLILEEVLTPEEVAIVYRGAEGQDVAADHGIVVSMDTTVTEELRIEGQARDLIRVIQKLRKESGLHFTDRIALSVNGLSKVMEAHGEAIAQETTAILQANEGKAQTLEVSGMPVTIRIRKV